MFDTKQKYNFGEFEFFSSSAMVGITLHESRRTLANLVFIIFLIIHDMYICYQYILKQV